MRRIWIVALIGGVVLPGAVALAAAAGFPPFLTTWGGPGSAPGSFSSPDMVTVDARGQVYVADRQNNRVDKFDYRGHLLSVIGREGSAAGQFRGPRGVAVDGLGDLYVADSGNNRIQKLDPSGNVPAVWGRNGGDGASGAGPGEFNDPRGIATDRAGNLYVADHGNNRIQKLGPSGKVLARWGHNGGDGLPGTGAGEFNKPRGVTVDSRGDVYVADKSSNRIQKFDARGRFLLKWGRNGGDGSAGNGNGQFHIPYSVAAGPNQLYVADTGNNRLQEFTFAGGFIQRLGRNGGDGAHGAAPGEFSTPYGVGVDCRGNLYVSDEGNDRVQVFGVTGGLPPICPPTVRLGPSAHLQAGALVLSAACDQPCSLSIRAAVREAGKVQRTTARRSLGLGVTRVQLRVALPAAAQRALRAGMLVRVRISVRPTGFAGTGQALSRQLELRS